MPLTGGQRVDDQGGVADGKSSYTTPGCCCHIECAAHQVLLPPVFSRACVCVCSAVLYSVVLCCAVLQAFDGSLRGLGVGDRIELEVGQHFGGGGMLQERVPVFGCFVLLGSVTLRDPRCSCPAARGCMMCIPPHPAMSCFTAQITGGQWKQELLFTVPRDHPEVERLEGRYKK